MMICLQTMADEEDGGLKAQRPLISMLVKP